MLLSIARNHDNAWLRRELRKRGELLRVFVFGTLKQGHFNHEAFMHGALSVEDAFVRGEMYGMGVPFVKVREEDIYDYGTADYDEDVRAQHGLTRAYARAMPLPPGEGEPTAYGEIVTLPDSGMLRDLDRLEGYRPGGTSVLYIRCLVPVYSEGGRRTELAWMYASQGTTTRFERIPSGVWSPR